MKHGDARMLTQVKDPVARDNFQRLNRLFGDGEFAMTFGEFYATVDNMSVPAPPNMLFHWHKIGRFITLQMDTDVTVASKVNTSNPALGGVLPFGLRPRSEQVIPFLTINNAAVVSGFVVIDPTGTVSWGVPAGAWTAGALARLYPMAFSYLGV